MTVRRETELDRAAERLGASATAIQADVTSKSDMQLVAERIKDAHRKLDILFANAGGGHATPIEKLTEEQIDSDPRYRMKLTITKIT